MCGHWTVCECDVMCRNQNVMASGHFVPLSHFPYTHFLRLRAPLESCQSSSIALLSHPTALTPPLSYLSSPSRPWGIPMLAAPALMKKFLKDFLTILSPTFSRERGGRKLVFCVSSSLAIASNRPGVPTLDRYTAERGDDNGKGEKRRGGIITLQRRRPRCNPI